MQLICLGSSSAGNGYILKNGTEVLVIEAGVPFLKVKEALNYDITKIVGLLVTHSHKDHSKYINDYLNARIPVWTGSLDGLDLKSSMLPYLSEHLHKFRLGNFSIKSIEVRHDVPCLSFLIKHAETGLIYFCTDTHFLPFRIKNLNQLIIEANYCEDILEENIDYVFYRDDKSIQLIGSYNSYSGLLFAALVFKMNEIDEEHSPQ